MLLQILMLGLAMVAHGFASGQDTYPSRPVRLVVGYAAGGTTDLQARIFAKTWSKELRQPVIVENRPGAGGAIGLDLVVKSEPDGYTVCFCTISQSILLPLTVEGFPIVPIRDLQPITLLYVSDGAIVMRPGLGVKSLADFISLARANPGKFTFGTTGEGTFVHLAGELVNARAGQSLLAVPYKGEAPALIDLMADRIDMFPLSTELAARYAEAGKLKILAVRGAQRSMLLPGVPTVAEAGFPGIESENQVGLFVPARTPALQVEKLYTTASAAVTSAEVKNAFGLGFRVVGNQPAVYAAMLRLETDKWTKLIKGLPVRKP